MLPVTMPSSSGSPVIPGDEALRIAQADAVRAYRDLSSYAIRPVLEEDGWHIDYEPKDPRFKGGGPHYVIDQFTGDIKLKRYEQQVKPTGTTRMPTRQPLKNPA